MKNYRNKNRYRYLKKLKRKPPISIPNRSHKCETIHENYLYDKDVFLCETLFGLSFDRKIKRRLKNFDNYKNLHFMTILENYK